MKIAVLISGRGSNLQALIDAANQPGWPAEIVLVISNVAGAQGLERAKAAGIPTTVINHKDFEDRETFDASMTEAIEKSAAGNGAELVCLAGFMRLLSTHFIDHWRDRLINIHPSLLPAFKGLEVHQRVLDAGEEFSGCTVHFVRPEMDTGPILLQTKVPVQPGDAADTLAARVLEQEHVIYPEAVRLIAEGRVKVDGELALIDGKGKN
ncbi:MAG TPA: phosphoribosylglycinamide formyltransferase [Rhodospirillales bacterium]|jgi:phosphoribosylglycinamide formyltransferase-1|nr:MAG: phosphoribosylglycinamide formyltransferase [Rhodospirillaceae bacterium]PPR73883.1 MAG: Phosphoribosylglycinamide formyltransferase [Alphaproteobacteria bacterium MarineAlpha3_Bin2]HIE19632.1 phosphoribosylglycinamide formyltransferase [Rhodospirillales bacterium]HIM24883.1 phosphoribosylglycinamide formyltransferase [Rhodospirillales bacterium]HIM77507.1 phosphoribosylglycinamide formyltransferase [Rhodospirillales bacterium]